MSHYKNILVIDNFDSFTFNLVDYLTQLNCKVTTLRNTISISSVAKIDPDLIVLSPGPSVPKNAGNLMGIIDRYHDIYPIFGVCLGHEALIEYFGGTLTFTEPVHGKASPIRHDGKTIFTGLEQNFMAGRYHSLIADKVPSCFCTSAKYKNIVMGVRHRSLPIEGVQFHPESVLTMKGQNGFHIIKNLVYGYDRIS